MVWLVRYTKYNSRGKVLTNQVGNMLGGNCEEVIQKVCRLKEIEPPKRHKQCSYIAEVPTEAADDFEVHAIVVAAEDQLIDV